MLDTLTEAEQYSHFITCMQVSLQSVYESANYTSIEEDASENASEEIESCEYMAVSNVSEHVSSPRSSLHLSECSLMAL